MYFNRHLGYYGFDLSKLTDYKFWIALPGTFPDFYYASELWQYSFESEGAGDRGTHGYEHAVCAGGHSQPLAQPRRGGPNEIPGPPAVQPAAWNFM